MKGAVPFVDPAQFNNIDETVKARAISRTRGSTGPSGADADQYRRMLMSQNYSSDDTDLRTAIAEVAKKLCTNGIDTKNVQLDAYIACRLIQLDKDGAGGIRPI